MGNYDIKLRPIHYASVSGGKDSLFMFYLICRNPDKYPLDMVVHYELEIDHDFVKNTVRYIEEKCKTMGIKFISIKPRKKYADLLEKYGVPNRVSRWCNGHYKLDCERQLREWIKSQNCRPVAYIGFCADEVKRFKYEIGNIQEGQDVIYPIAEEGTTEDEILKWARGVNLFENWYDYFNRQGCKFCPMMTQKELAYMFLTDKPSFDWFIGECKKTEQKYNTTIFSGNKKYNAEYIENNVKKKWVPILWSEMKEKNHPLVVRYKLVVTDDMPVLVERGKNG